MATNNDSYSIIKNKMNALKNTYPSLRNKPDSYVFSALCVKSNLYKNPAIVLYENDFEDIIVDSQYDGGVDILLTEPNSESSDLVIAQSKFYESISYDDVMNAMTKMALFYKDMTQGHFEQVNFKVQKTFLSLYSELGEESKIHFIFYTSALQSGIKKKNVEKKFREQFSESSQFEVSIYFGKDVEEEIKESESRRPTVEYGKICIDKKDNYLMYNDDAAIVNVSAFSIKELYAQHNINLLARNLRYHIRGAEIDKGIEDTIRNNPDSFWLKNNGITIVCDDFDIDGKEVKLRNFSIINGGQTTYMLHKSKNIDAYNDLYLPCKIVKTEGQTEDEKNDFSLAVAKATNTQKPIKAVDLKANSPEQVRFAQTMREVGVYYQTKRGEVVPSSFKEPYLNSSLVDTGKLCLAAIFQMPGASRNKPSLLYQPQYYEKIFGGNPAQQLQIAKLSKELLYVDYYFRNAYIKIFDKENNQEPDSNIKISFAHNARTICIAFVAFAARFYQGNFDMQDIQAIFDAARSDDMHNSTLYDIFSDLDGVQSLFPQNIFNDKDRCDEILKELFSTIINSGIRNFITDLYSDSSLNATNYLKKDKNYYKILQTNWIGIKKDIEKIYNLR